MIYITVTETVRISGIFFDRYFGFYPDVNFTSYPDADFESCQQICAAERNCTGLVSSEYQQCSLMISTEPYNFVTKAWKIAAKEIIYFKQPHPNIIFQTDIALSE